MLTNILLLIFIGFGWTYDAPIFINGRPRGGFTGVPYVEHPELLENAEEHWFTQTLDHFDDSDIRSWKQRYFVNTSNHNPSGPVFLMVGGEGTLSPNWLSVGAMVDYAVENHALMLSLEHRFYGKSHPLPDTSISSLRYLSSEQALADLATFRVAMTKKFGLSDQNKWIIFGGSYPGGLSAWFRYKYPHLAHGAVASSAPMQAQLDFPEYLEVSTASLGTKECKDNVKKATTTVENHLKTENGLKYLSEKFRTCTALTKNINDQMQFTSGLANNFFGIIQYNKDNRAWEGAYATNISINVLCAIMNNKEYGDVVDRYAEVNKMMMKIYGSKCLEISYSDFIKFMKTTDWKSPNAEGARQWTYQTCTEFGYYQSTDSPRQVFGKTFPLSFFVQQCVDVYGKAFNETNNLRGINWTNAYYGGYSLAKGATRIIFPNGSIDPWHALSFTKSEEEIIAIYIIGTAHCANMYPASPTDSEGLVKARSKIGKIIGKWLSSK